MFSHYNTGLIFVPAQKRIQLIQSEHLMITEKVWKETAQLRPFALLMQRIVSEVKPMISIVAVSKSSKLEPFSVLDIQSVLNLMQFLHTHRNMHSVFL